MIILEDVGYVSTIIKVKNSWVFGIQDYPFLPTKQLEYKLIELVFTKTLFGILGFHKFFIIILFFYKIFVNIPFILLEIV
jgi:hypothetical protein